MEKQKIKLSDLAPRVNDEPFVFQKNSCEKIRKEVNEFLSKQCSSKVNQLRKCTKCNIVHKEWPLISSPMDAKFLNTAFDGVNGMIDPTNLNDGQTDLHWEAGKGDDTGPASVTNWIPAFVGKCTAWVASPFGNANWISLYKNTAHYTDPVTNVQEGNIDVYFRYRFYLNSNVLTSQFTLDMNFFADNSVHEIYVNQIKQSTYHSTLLPQAQTGTETGYKGFIDGNQVHISLANDWKSCENEIIVHVKSGLVILVF